MKPSWLSDARRIPDEVMSDLRVLAVHAIRARGERPEAIVRLLGLSRSSVYEWLKRFDEGGYEALETRQAPGAAAVITPEMDAWLERVVAHTTPRAFGLGRQAIKNQPELKAKLRTALRALQHNAARVKSLLPAARDALCRSISHRVECPVIMWKGDTPDLTIAPRFDSWSRNSLIFIGALFKRAPTKRPIVAKRSVF